ncbi:MAG: hypothetical protein A3B96_04390 [Candidatus Spechtbacteria bacterium RIFCSPHIGHO2_02_FULL_43_15b]|uniref:Uncharacterized protein n=1 Tax=Candidatus Spechtbacteria bacterium RIFCSPHIGHO2_01_FULL_43_30 TaxID=1802158 RepID=A0A1G2H7K9_9BACT|nr:MAG: hypothetical protein A2827_01950 [Candidatus Spechtbacteria bacterium RIFCSPHIGHO2_01_FULL_43_30]OGZ58574.1 MAG: hypothetical protein A3B96_04390 [Candidatus Spechtbacteria bacterium RIFCSPHIGHO2_02_FULL_43_15b]
MVYATCEEEALGIALKNLEERFPRAESWSDHTISVVEVDIKKFQRYLDNQRFKFWRINPFRGH